MVLQAAEEAKVREIEETKQRKRQEILEKRKLEREREELKKNLELRFKKNCRIADDFYRKLVLRRGFNLFKRLVKRNEKITQIIEDRQNTSLLRQILNNWHNFRKGTESYQFRSRTIVFITGQNIIENLVLSSQVQFYFSFENRRKGPTS